METEFLTADQALRFINACEKDKVFIFGVERFICVDGRITPDLGGIADFSSLSSQDVSGSVSSARSFLSLFGDVDQERFKLVY
ncbi:MAG: hypothetical protein Q4G36_07570 [Paracoccus sp. (in: a-proteobacteria)]|nr:hypothetical protein [Paracoccus sp. (in: a-proteobacteria)]